MGFNFSHVSVSQKKKMLLALQFCAVEIDYLMATIITAANWKLANCYTCCWWLDQSICLYVSSFLLLTGLRTGHKIMIGQKLVAELVDISTGSHRT